MNAKDINNENVKNAEIENEYTDIEVYKLYNGILHDHFKSFEYKYGEKRISCAKMTKEGKEQWIHWSDNNGYNLNDVKRGDILMLLKMHPKKNWKLDRIFYKVISRTKDKLVCQWANGDVSYTTYLKALKAPLPTVVEAIAEYNLQIEDTNS